MAVIGSDHLSLRVGDGSDAEIFTALKGVRLARVEISQKSNVSTAISTDGWLVEAGVSGRRAVLECEAFATDEPAAVRLRTLAMMGAAGNFRLEVSPVQTLVFSATITNYREMIDAGEIKRLQCRLESSGAVTVI